MWVIIAKNFSPSPAIVTCRKWLIKFVTITISNLQNVVERRFLLSERGSSFLMSVSRGSNLEGLSVNSLGMKYFIHFVELFMINKLIWANCLRNLFRDNTRLRVSASIFLNKNFQKTYIGLPVSLPFPIVLIFWLKIFSNLHF